MIDFLLSINATTWGFLAAVFYIGFLYFVTCLSRSNHRDFKQEDIEQAAYFRQVAANKLAKGRKLSFPQIPPRGTDKPSKPRSYQPTTEFTLCLDSRGFRNVPIKPKFSEAIAPPAMPGFVSRLRKGPQ